MAEVEGANRQEEYRSSHGSRMQPLTSSQRAADAVNQLQPHIPGGNQSETLEAAIARAFDSTRSTASTTLIAQISQNLKHHLQHTAGLDDTLTRSKSRSMPSNYQPPTVSPDTAAHSSSVQPSSAETTRENHILTSPELSSSIGSDNGSEDSDFESSRPLPTSTLERASKMDTAGRPPSPVNPSASSDYRSQRRRRPPGPKRLDTTMQQTTLEKIWGPLFDDNSRPTSKFSRLLRGLATYLIDNYEPTKSTVITPSKMLKYYSEFKVPGEAYEWDAVFDHERSSISRLYRDHMCQHFLVQAKFDERPDLPSLTPSGFEKWVVLLIRAQPDIEFKRLQKAVLEMPISDPDDPKTRFPKDLSRRLFPDTADMTLRLDLEDSLVVHTGIDVPPSTAPSSKPADSVSPERKTVAAPQTSTLASGPVPEASTRSHRPSVSFADNPITSSSDDVKKDTTAKIRPTGNMASHVQGSVARSTTSASTASTTMPSPVTHLAKERDRTPYALSRESNTAEVTQSAPSEKAPRVSLSGERERAPYSSAQDATPTDERPPRGFNGIRTSVAPVYDAARASRTVRRDMDGSPSDPRIRVGEHDRPVRSERVDLPLSSRGVAPPIPVNPIPPRVHHNTVPRSRPMTGIPPSNTTYTESHHPDHTSSSIHHNTSHAPSRYATDYPPESTSIRPSPAIRHHQPHSSSHHRHSIASAAPASSTPIAIPISTSHRANSPSDMPASYSSRSSQIMSASPPLYTDASDTTRRYFESQARDRLLNGSNRRDSTSVIGSGSTTNGSLRRDTFPIRRTGEYVPSSAILDDDYHARYHPRGPLPPLNGVQIRSLRDRDRDRENQYDYERETDRERMRGRRYSRV